MENLHPIIQTLFATGVTWFATALGAATVFLTAKPNQKMMDSMLGFAAGIMIAASYWSLLAPAIEMSQGRSLPAWFPPLVGFLLGGVFLRLADKLIPHIHMGISSDHKEGVKTNWRRSTLLIGAVTLHNIPEGLAVGVAFAAAASQETGGVPIAAVALSIGLALQNMPEGMAVAIPLRREGLSRFKSFMWGQFSGMVEPIAGVLGATVVVASQSLLPYALGFAAGAMIFVVVEELIPEAQRHGNTDVATMGSLIGFALMMVMDVAIG